MWSYNPDDEAAFRVKLSRKRLFNSVCGFLCLCFPGDKVSYLKFMYYVCIAKDMDLVLLKLLNLQLVGSLADFRLVV